MGRGIGLSGAHRTGKTSICREIENLYNGGVVFVPTTSSDVAARLGFDTTAQHDFGSRLHFQLELLDTLETIWDSAKNTYEVWVTDRTPLDLLAYTYIDSHSWDFTVSRRDELHLYYNKCVQVLDKYFNEVFLLPTDGVIMEGDVSNKGRNSIFYQEHLDLIYRGLTTEIDKVIIIEDRSYQGKRKELFSKLLYGSIYVKEA